MIRARRALHWAVCLPALASLAGCVSVSEFRKLERDVRAVQKGGGGAGAAGSREQMADVAARLDSLQADLRRIEGRIEVVEHRSTEALDEARKARRDAQGAPETGAAPRASAPALAPAVADEPAPLGTPPAPQRAPAPATVAAPTPAPEASASAAAPAPANAEDGSTGASAEEVQAYRDAFAAWQRNDPDACIDQFRRFLQAHPASIYADDGTYWMADCYFKKGDYRTALLRFDDVQQKWPKGNKAADAIYRQGETLVRMGSGYQPAAKKAFERIVNEYPSSARAPEAKKQIEQLAARSGGGR